MKSDHSVPTRLETIAVGANPGRRKIVALLLASPWLPSLAHAASSAATGTVGSKFMALSLFATGRSTLDPEIGT